MLCRKYSYRIAPDKLLERAEEAPSTLIGSALLQEERLGHLLDLARAPGHKQEDLIFVLELG